ncbi:CDP-glycerol glycerophosphotransferase family protein [Arthrobacter sp. I2-34]|uniref:CDP-glycerol glycerophosphotransferase family protein n=1 Tax=Arthrobacter hankyongi TaxID=2904801 RepID=A0ABS9L6F9_9MICC|nr:CDP-glycerol glycerophosphotransferase family protein [Arthrobacter hankyongi]MCG2622270.1 CDP-glycerol glycerophosphotransferase family protein [Arthrobacter hankyongi]
MGFVGALRTLPEESRNLAQILALSALAVVGCILVLSAEDTFTAVIGTAIAAAAYLAIGWLKRRPLRHLDYGGLLATYVSVRVVLAVTAGAFYARLVPAHAGWSWAALGLTAVVVLQEPVLKKILGGKRQQTAHLPGAPALPARPYPAGTITRNSLAVIGLSVLLAAFRVPGWIPLILAVGQLLPVYRVARYAVLTQAISKQNYDRLPELLKKHKPEFAVYYAALKGAEYQLGMWLPYLERLDRPFVVITKNPATVPVIAGLTSAPVVSVMEGVAGALDRMVVPSLKAAYYVQGSPGNAAFQRYRKLTHIWLNHGDSDKEANFHPRHATYDKLFVCGEQGVARYAAHGIEIPRAKFELVGRPQVEKIEFRENATVPAAPTILYAPTWQGGRPSTSYSSLPIGPDIVKALLERGATVVFRPHPLSYGIPADKKQVLKIHDLLRKDADATGRQHVFGPAAEKELDVAGCFNLSDALVTDVSSIASEYLASGKPFAMAAITSGGEAFLREFPTAQVAYVIEKDLSTLAPALNDLLGSDPLSAKRAERRRYCLGDVIGPEAAQPFVEVSLAILDRAPVAKAAISVS